MWKHLYLTIIGIVGLKLVFAQPDPGCNNVTYGGVICCGEEGCGFYDPGIITSEADPTGGEGELEYVWLRSDDLQGQVWVEIPNTNSAEYDPGYITETTYFIRYSRRSGCPQYVGVSNIIEKTVWPQSPTIEPIIPVICNGEPAVLTTQPSAEYTWSTGEHVQTIAVQDTGNYWVLTGCGDTSDVFFVGAAELDPPMIEETLPCVFQVVNYFDSLNYQWLIDGSEIPGSTGQVIADAVHGTYSVLAASDNGCLVESNELPCYNNTDVKRPNEHRPSVVPNPSKGLFRFDVDGVKECAVYDVFGRLVYRTTLHDSRWLNISRVPPGVYYTHVRVAKEWFTLKLIRE